jgi:hypothetical protein
MSGEVLSDGTIVVGQDAVIVRGQAFVSRVQAAQAKVHGWRKVWGPNEDGLVLVERGNRHPFPFGKSRRAMERRRERRYKQQLRGEYAE